MFSLRTDALTRRIPEVTDRVFLTFDDGPCPELTPRVLDLLKAARFQASFFVIGERARQFPELIQRMIREGHGVFSHSIDHRYGHYFRGKNHLKGWISGSLEQLNRETGSPSRLFRPPAGVVTPPLVQAAAELKTPLVLWNHRFYDRTRPWTAARAQRSLRRLVPGDIVLLHDRQKASQREVFMETLAVYVQGILSKSLRSGALDESNFP